MSVVRQVYSWMASRKPVLLADGRTGVITRVDTSFPENETTVHVWMKTDGEPSGGPGLAKVNAKNVTGPAREGTKKTA